MVTALHAACRDVDSAQCSLQESTGDPLGDGDRNGSSKRAVTGRIRAAAVSGAVGRHTTEASPAVWEGLQAFALERCQATDAAQRGDGLMCSGLVWSDTSARTERADDQVVRTVAAWRIMTVMTGARRDG